MVIKLSELGTRLPAQIDNANKYLTTNGLTPSWAVIDLSNLATKIYTDSAVSTAISNLINSAPAALDTLNELALALGSDASFSTTVSNSIAMKAPISSPTFTGTVTISGDINLSAAGGPGNIKDQLTLFLMNAL